MESNDINPLDSLPERILKLTSDRELTIAELVAALNEPRSSVDRTIAELRKRKMLTRRYRYNAMAKPSYMYGAVRGATTLPVPFGLFEFDEELVPITNIYATKLSELFDALYSKNAKLRRVPDMILKAFAYAIVSKGKVKVNYSPELAKADLEEVQYYLLGLAYLMNQIIHDAEIWSNAEPINSVLGPTENLRAMENYYTAFCRDNKLT